MSLLPVCLPGKLQPIQLPQMGLDLDVGNAFLMSRRGIDTSFTGNEGRPMQSTFNLSNKCNLSDQSMAIPSAPNTTTSEMAFGFEPTIQAYGGEFDLSSNFKVTKTRTTNFFLRLWNWYQLFSCKYAGCPSSRAVRLRSDREGVVLVAIGCRMLLSKVWSLNEAISLLSLLDVLLQTLQKRHNIVLSHLLEMYCRTG